MISSTLAELRIASVPGTDAHPASARVQGQWIRLLEGLASQEGVRFELGALSELPTPASLVEWNGFLLGHSVAGTSLLRVLPRPLVVEAPWFAEGHSQPGSLIWPFEDTHSIPTAPAAFDGDAWIETSVLARAGVVRAAELADLRARELEQPFVAWVNSGFGEIERFALQAVRAALPHREIRELSLEDVLDRRRAWVDAPQSLTAPVLLCLGRTAIPLGRLLGISGWVARSGSGADTSRAVAQAWGEGAALTLPLVLDALGALKESETLAQLAREEARSGLNGLTERVIARFTSTEGSS